MSEGLPKGWAEAPIIEISHIVYGKGLPQNKLVENGEFPVFGANSIIGYYDDYRYEKPQILISCRGANSGVINISPPKCYVTSNSLVVELPHKYYECISFLYYSLKSCDKSSVVTGTAQPQVTIDNLGGFLIPLPPLNEQKRIVTKLDAIMPRIDAVKERLDRVPGILKRFRQSVLTAAVTGKITEKWREEHTDVEGAEVLLKRIKNGNKIEIKDYPYSLPDEWLVCGFYDVAIVKSSLVDPKNYQDFPHIAPDSIERDTGKLLSYNSIKEDKVTSPKHLFRRGQILYSKIRPYLSKVILVDFEGLCSADMYPIESKIDIKYLFYNILSNTFLDFASTAGTRSVLPKINQEELGQIPIPLPPLEEQKEIVRQVDKLFALADKVEAHYQKAKAQVDKLSQSVLAKAFRGELVPQDPNDEPAEKLLERISEEKAKMEAQLKGARKRGVKKTVKKSEGGT